MSKPRRLGRGLEALLARPAEQPEATTSSADVSNQPPAAATPLPEGVSIITQQGQSIRVDQSHGVATPASRPPTHLPIKQIDSNPNQPRQDFDPADIHMLADSLTNHGLLQPVVVRRLGDRYQLIAGERRLRAAIEADWNEVPVRIVEADDRQVAELAIIENLQRKDLNPLEKAASFQRYLQEYGSTQEELASRLDIDRSTVANLIRLLELPEPVRESLRRGRITQGHARALLPLGDEREQIAFAGRIETEGLSVRRTEAMVHEMIAEADAEPLTADGKGSKSSTGRPRSDHLAALEQEFRAALGMKVKLTHSTRGRGKLVVSFSDHEEFERLRQHVCGPQ